MEHFPVIPGYKIEKKIGNGATAIVYKATQEALKRKVAIKVLDHGLLKDQNYSRRFISEAEIAAKLHHSNIVTIFDIGKPGNTGNYCYIIMEYLAKSLKARMHPNGMPAEEALGIVKQLAGALDYAHSKGVVHRDIKPGNILFREDKTPVLVDFGLAFKINSDTNIMDPGPNMGTFRYMSPEQRRGEMVDQLSDIYSLGVVLYEMLTGVAFMSQAHAAISKKNPNAPVPYLPAHLRQYQPLIKKMLAPDKKDRFQNGKQVIEMIDRLIVPVTRREKKRFLTLPNILIMTACIFLAVMIAIWILKSIPQSPPQVSVGKTSTEVQESTIEQNYTNDVDRIQVVGGVIQFSLSGGLFENQVEVQLNSNPLKSNRGDVIDADIYYTLDGREPTKMNGTKYTMGQSVVIQMVGTYTLKARLISKVGKYEGPVCSQTYSIQAMPVPPEIETIYQIDQLSREVRADIFEKTKSIIVEVKGVSEVKKNGLVKMLLFISPTGVGKVIRISNISVEPKDKLSEIKATLNKKINELKFVSPTSQGGESVKLEIWINFNNFKKYKDKFYFYN